MARLIFTLLILFFPARVMAQDIVITKDLCAQVTEHIPDADVTYQPGVDARGRPVAPADLPGSSVVTVPDELVVDLRTFLGDSLNIDIGETGAFTEAAIFDVKYNTKTREVLLNDKLLVAVSDTSLVSLCKKYFESGEAVPAEESSDPVKPEEGSVEIPAAVPSETELGQ